MTNTQRRDMYQEVTSIIIEALEDGVKPWIQPWGSGAPLAMPKRHNGEPYNGINVVILWSVAMKHGYASPFWMTYKQARELGGQVRKGEKASPVFYAGSLKIEDEDSDSTTGEDGEKFIRYMKSYRVFNVEQIDGLPEKYAPAPPVPEEEDAAPLERNDRAEIFVTNTGADIRHRHGNSGAAYNFAEDYIYMPAFESFRSSHGYYATLFHELSHWTGHKSRLDRSQTGKCNTEYAFEELIAELGAAFLCADHGMFSATEENYVAYLQSWISLLKDDKRAIFRAASAAQKAADYLHGLQPDHSGTDPDGSTRTEQAKEGSAEEGKADQEEPVLAREKPAPEICEIIWKSGWQAIKVQVSCKRNYFAGYDHLEIRSVDPAGAALPITETGYRSHFAPDGEIDAFGGAAAAALMLLETEAQATNWKRQQEAERQGSLF